jgi:glycosyltransferase involved in cell wall biosynthesis
LVIGGADDVTGFLVRPGNVAGLAVRIVQLAGSADLRTRLAASGRELCRVRFDHHSMTRQIRELYELVLRQDRTRTT